MQEKAKILVVDDEVDDRSAISDVLKNEGYTVLEAADGEEGATIALQEHPDLILLDIIMPSVSGVDVLRRLREDEWGRTAKVVVLTVADDMDKMAEVVELGGQVYLLKTEVSLHSLVEKVREYVRS